MNLRTNRCQKLAFAIDRAYRQQRRIETASTKGSADFNFRTEENCDRLISEIDRIRRDYAWEDWVAYGLGKTPMPYTTKMVHTTKAVLVRRSTLSR